MRIRLHKQGEAGLTLFEVGVVVAIVVIVAVLLLQVLAKAKRRSARIQCVNNLKQIGLAYRVWAGDNNDLYPMGISVTNGGSMEMVQTGNVVLTFQVMSNELGTARLLICNGDEETAGDTSRTVASDFRALSGSNVSYCVGVDVTNHANPQAILSGDSNFEIRGAPAKTGLFCVSTNEPVAWDASRHRHKGNLIFADGSLQKVTSSRLSGYFERSGYATNRLAIP